MKEEIRLYREKYGTLEEGNEGIHTKLKNVTNYAINQKDSVNGYVNRRKMKAIVKDFLNQKINRIPIAYMKNSSQDCFSDIKDIYK